MYLYGCSKNRKGKTTSLWECLFSTALKVSDVGNRCYNACCIRWLMGSNFSCRINVQACTRSAIALP